MKLKELGLIEILTDDLNERAWMGVKGGLINDKTILVYRTLGSTIYRVEVSKGKNKVERQFPSEADACKFIANELSDEMFYIRLVLLGFAAIAAVGAIVLFHT